MPPRALCATHVSVPAAHTHLWHTRARAAAPRHGRAPHTPLCRARRAEAPITLASRLPHQAASTSQCAYLLVIAMVRRSEKLVKVGGKALEESEGGVRDESLVELCRGTLMAKYVPSMRGGGDMLSGLLGGLLR